MSTSNPTTKREHPIIFNGGDQMTTNTTTEQAFRLMVTTWENDNECGEGGNAVTSDRYFGLLPDVLDRLQWPWLDGFQFAVYQEQSDKTWLLYYHSI